MDHRLGGFPMNSQSTMFLEAAQLVADLHQRASFDTPALVAGDRPLVKDPR
jgi:hypothetical protein